jgi:hypothetical protein
MTPRDYTLEIREDGARLSKQAIDDPFINTTITVRGWRSAWAVLRRGVTLNLILDGSGDTIAHVMSGTERADNQFEADVLAFEGKDPA